MNEYTFEQIEVGQTESFDVCVTSEMMDAFRTITGDVNPLHNDLSYAQSLNYPDRVCFGMLTASFFSTLAGVYLPGKYSLIHQTEVEFPLRVLPGDKLTIVGEVREKDERFGTIRLAVTVRNQDGKKVCRGKMTVGVTK